MRRWGLALAAGVLLVVVAIVAGVGGKKNAAGDTVPSELSAVPVSEEFNNVPDSSVADSTPDVEVEPVITAKPKSILKRSLRKGMKGADVKRLQQRLVDLGYDPGDVNGKFDQPTRTAVWAFEKLVMRVPPKKVTGIVTKAMWLRMQDNLVVKPKRPKASKVHLEVYLPEQVAVLFEKGKARLITHISSGTGKWWKELVTIDPGEDGNVNGKKSIQAIVKGISITPGGVFKFYRRYVDDKTRGWREGRLGRMYHPVYFNKGLAVHGANEVPKYPASHGCIRIPMHIAEYFPDLVQNGDQVFVWDGKKQPEAYGAQPPKADSITRVTSTTVKAATTTTVKPTTTVKKTTTTVKKTTTTVGSTTATSS